MSITTKINDGFRKVIVHCDIMSGVNCISNISRGKIDGKILQGSFIDSLSDLCYAINK